MWLYLQKDVYLHLHCGTILHKMTWHAQQLCRIVLQVFFPLAPGIESIWEPFQEEVEERVQEVQRQIDEVMDGTLLTFACST